MATRLAPTPEPTARTAWRSRYTLAGLIRLFGFIALIGVIAFFFVAGYLAQYLSTTVRGYPSRTPAAVGLAYSEIEFPAAVDGVTIRGWWVPAAGSDRTVVFLHGKDNNRSSGPALEVARALNAAGYNALLFDFRGCGYSDGERYSLGYFEVRDVSGAIDYLAARHPEAAERVAVIGFSMGAATALLATGQDRRIQAAITDSAYADVIDLLEREIPRQSRLPSLITWPVVWMGQILQGYDISSIRPIETLAALDGRSVFLIHGTNDGVVVRQHFDRLMAALANGSSGPASETWLVPEAGHVGAHGRDPAAYQQRIVNFLNRALPARASTAAA